MIGREAERLIRRSWASVDQLAQELYAIFTADLPIETSNLTVNQPAGSTTAPVTVRQPFNPGGNPPTISIQNGNTTTTLSGNGGTISIGGFTGGTTTIDIGDTTFGGLDFPGNTNPGGNGGGGGDLGGGGTGGGGGTDLGGLEFPGQNPDDKVFAVPAPADNPFVMHGVVGEKLGSNTYAVTCFAKDPQTARPIGVVNVTQGQISADDTIPPGTEVLVIAFPGKDSSGRQTILGARMYVPVYLEDPS